MRKRNIAVLLLTVLLLAGLTGWHVVSSGY